MQTADVRSLKKRIGQLHGRTSYSWNRQEQCSGRKVWHAVPETWIKSERHFWATLNYIHYNPVKHRYVDHWLDWPWSSGKDFLDYVGEREVERIWEQYPIKHYGESWDCF